MLRHAHARDRVSAHLWIQILEEKRDGLFGSGWCVR